MSRQYRNADEWIAQRITRRRIVKGFDPASLTLHPDRFDGIVFGDFATYAAAKTDILTRFTLSTGTDTTAALDATVTVGGKSTAKFMEADRIRFKRSIVAPTIMYVRQMFRLSPTHIAGKQFIFSKVVSSSGNYFPFSAYKTANDVLYVSDGSGGTDNYAAPLSSFKGVWHTILQKFDWTGGTGGIPTTTVWLDKVKTHDKIDYTFALTLPADNMDTIQLELGSSQVAGTDAVNNYSHHHLVEFVDGNAHPAPYGPDFV